MVDIIAVYSKAENLIITTLYRQPDDSAHNRQSKCQEFKSAILALQKVILELDVVPDIIIGGDFNLSEWNWVNKTLQRGTQHAQQHYHLSDILDDNGLT